MLEKFQELSTDKKIFIILGAVFGVFFIFYMLAQLLSPTVQPDETITDISDNIPPVTIIEEPEQPAGEDRPNITGAWGTLGEDGLCYDDDGVEIDPTWCEELYPDFHDESDFFYNHDLNFSETATVFLKQICNKEASETVENVFTRVSVNEKIMVEPTQYRNLIFREGIETSCQPLSVEIVEETEEYSKLVYSMNVFISFLFNDDFTASTIKYDVTVTKTDDKTYAVSEASTQGWEKYMVEE